jgi:predicted ThiF/HesA family dinucleotide-utilizing enzyme
VNTETGQQIVVVGVGNVGLQAILTLALVHRSIGITWRVAVVDFDSVKENDIRKGYRRCLLGRFKAEAAVDMVREMYGKETSASFHPVVAAAQSVPGLIREAEAVFNGTDSSLDAAYVSEEARNSWEVRLSTGIFGNTATHTVEVMPQGYTLGEVSYDSAAWADAARHQCMFGTPENSFAGVPQPFGTVTGALAVHLFLARNGEKDRRNQLIRVNGPEINQWYGRDEPNRFVRVSQEIPLPYEANFARLWGEVAMRFGVSAEDMRLGFPTPIVTRQCANQQHGLYRGFERQPAWGRCAICSEKTYCHASPRDVALEEVADLKHMSLHDLHAPAGLRFTAYTRCGRQGTFHLPFRLEDVPELPERGEHGPAGLKTGAGGADAPTFEETR